MGISSVQFTNYKRNTKIQFENTFKSFFFFLSSICSNAARASNTSGL